MKKSFFFALHQQFLSLSDCGKGSLGSVLKVAMRSWEEYKVRLGNHGKRMKAMGINFYPSAQVPWVE